jgi:hypothetical protein
MADSSDWSTAKVLAHLRDSAGEGEPVRAQIFLHDNVTAEDLAGAVETLVKTARERVGAREVPVEIGKIHRLAKSFSIKADPDFVAALAKLPAVKSILPSEISDIYPKPVKRTPA